MKVEIFECNDEYMVNINIGLMLYPQFISKYSSTLADELLTIKPPTLPDKLIILHKINMNLDIKPETIDDLRKKTNVAMRPIYFKVDLPDDDKTYLIIKVFDDIILYYFITAIKSAGVLARHCINVEQAYYACALQIAKEYDEFRSEVATIIAKHSQ